MVDGMFYYTYILKCIDNTYYTGITTDVVRRFSEHKFGGKLSAKYTKRHKPISVEAVWRSDNRSAASKLEYFIKKLSHSEKEMLISSPNILNLKYNDYFLNIDYAYEEKYKNYTG